MHQSKLVQLFGILDPGEVKRLLPFLKSPYFNSNPHIVKFYRLLRSEYPDFTSPKLTKEKVFSKLFPKRTYDHQKMLNLMSDFSNLLKKYFQVLQLEKQEWIQQRLLLETYAEHPKFMDIFLKAYTKTQHSLEESPERDAQYYRKKFWLHQLYLDHPGIDKFQVTKSEYDATMNSLDRYFQLEKLLLSCNMKAREKPLSEQYEIWLLEEVRKGSRINEEGHPIYRAYTGMLDLLESNAADAYFKLKATLFGHFDQFTRQQQQNILQSLINFTIQEGNRGQQNFLEENLELYQFGLQEKLLLEQGLLNDMVFISIVNIALRAGAHIWCLSFIQDHGGSLEPGTQKDAQSLATALYYYTTGDLDTSMSILQTVDFLNVYYQIQARVLLIKVYFEYLEIDDTYYELVYSQTKSFERYLRRDKKVSDANKTSLLNFCSTVKRLAQLRMDRTTGQENKLNRLKAEVQTLNPVYNKSWVLQQLGAE